jgi:hypothetical protein
MAMGFCLVADITRTGLAAANEWIDERSDQRNEARAYEAAFQRRTDEIEDAKRRFGRSCL